MIASDSPCAAIGVRVGDERGRPRFELSGAVALLLGVLLLPGCKLYEMFAELDAMATAVQELAGTDEISINVEGGETIGVTVVNASVNDEASGVRARLARRIATKVASIHGSRERLKRVGVVYMAHEPKFVFFGTFEVVDTFVFTSDELELPSQQDTSTSSAQ